MKIAIIFPATTTKDGFGGMHKFVSILDKYLSENDDEVTTIFLDEKFYYPSTGKVIELKHKIVKNKFGKIIKAFFRWIKLNHVLKKQEFDLIYNLFWLTPLLSIRYRKKMISAIHSNPFSWSPTWQFIAKKIFPLSKLIIVPSLYVERGMRDVWGITNVIAINNPIDFIDIKIAAAGVLNILCNQNFILAAGRLSPEKNFNLLIEAYCLSKLSNLANLIIIGDGPQKLELQLLIKNKNVENKVLLLGLQDNPFIYMKHCRFFVISSYTECFPMVMLEALACEVPVISTDWPGASDVIKHEINGLLTKNNAVFDLSQAMDRLYFDVELYKYCKNNTKTSVSGFSKDKIMKQYRDTFLSYINSEVN